MSNRYNDPFSEPVQNTLYAEENQRTGTFEYETLASYTTKTFLWMFAGLMLTFGIALVGYAGGLARYLLVSPMMFLAWPLPRWWWSW